MFYGEKNMNVGWSQFFQIPTHEKKAHTYPFIIHLSIRIYLIGCDYFAFSFHNIYSIHIEWRLWMSYAISIPINPEYYETYTNVETHTDAYPYISLTCSHGVRAGFCFTCLSNSNDVGVLHGSVKYNTKGQRSGSRFSIFSFEQASERRLLTRYCRQTFRKYKSDDMYTAEDVVYSHDLWVHGFFNFKKIVYRDLTCNFPRLDS